MSIHPLAVVSPDAILGAGVTVGPFAVIEGGVVLGEHCTVGSGAVIKSGVTAGSDNEFHEHVVIGGAPQHVARPAHVGGVRIGHRNVFREHSTVHRALHAEGHTSIGDGNYLMVGVHVGHDTVIGDHCIFANAALLGGHVTVEDRAFVSGAVAVHQFCRIGRLAMVGGHARVTQDVPPYMLIDGQTGCVVGLNVVGLRRGGYTGAMITELKAAYRIIYRRGIPWAEVLEALALEFPSGPVVHLQAFLSNGKRGFAQERRGPPGVTLRIRTPETEPESAHAHARAG